MYRLVLSREASRLYERCAKADAIKLARCFTSLERDPRSGNNVKALKGQLNGAYRYRVGRLRVVFTIDEQSTTVFVITIADRKDVYD